MLTAIIATGALAVIAGTALAQGGQPVDVRASMQEQVNPAMLEIWAIGNSALDDSGALDPAMMDGQKWNRLEDAAGTLAAAGRALAAGDRFLAAAAGNSEVAEGEIAMAQVQQHIDAAPQAFRVLAAGLATRADKLAALAKAQDIAAGDEISEMDALCESCHARFWYP